jgi:diaminopimelate decarboxylase
VITERRSAGLRENGISPAGRTLQIEPGRATFGSAGVHVGRVLGVKRQADPGPLAWVQTDTSETFLPDATLDHYLWPFMIANRAEAPAQEKADIVGMACSMDRLIAQADVPVLEAGDLVAFLDTGAYQDAVSCNRNLLGRPATVLIRGAQHEIVKRAETLDDVLARDIAAA